MRRPAVDPRWRGQLAGLVLIGAGWVVVPGVFGWAVAEVWRAFPGALR